MVLAWLPVLLALAGACLMRLWYVLPRKTHGPKRLRRPFETCSVAVFLGSGGHTSEAIALLSGLDFSRYSPRTYYLSEGDTLSMKKAAALETLKAREHTSNMTEAKELYTFIVLPRARHVHQSLLTTPLTVVRSFAACMRHLTLAPLLSKSAFPDILIVNGPGTCVVLCLAAYINRVVGLPSPTLIYVESFARVRTLSLSGKLLRPFIDRFVVQWPGLASKGECLGWLV